MPLQVAGSLLAGLQARPEQFWSPPAHLAQALPPWHCSELDLSLLATTCSHKSSILFLTALCCVGLGDICLFFSRALRRRASLLGWLAGF